MAAGSPAARRAGVVAVHSLDHFVFSVPDLDAAAKFYDDFGLEVRHGGDRLHLHTVGHSHRWGTVLRGDGPKKLQYLAFGAYADDFDAIRARVAKQGVAEVAAHPRAESSGLWFRDPEGVTVHVLVAPKVSPESKIPAHMSSAPVGTAAAPGRSRAPKVRPRRLSHVLLFTSDVPRSSGFYADTIGLRLADRSGDGIAFMYGAHASDHHMVAFAKSDGPGLHHSSWDVASIEDVGLGMEQMTGSGHPHGWGVGRHVLGSNYFYYARDPWGSFAEYSHDIDFIPADLEWPAADHPPEDSFYLWGPPPPDYFVQNHETAARKA
jgi:catechol 2,3-dioxygenase-like lactoylglutathione lyase family enzyme